MRARSTSHGFRRRLRMVAVHSALFALGAFPSVVRSDCQPAQVDAPDASIHVDPAARQRQAEALRTLSPESLELSPWGPVSLLQGRTNIVLPPDITGREAGKPANDILRLLSELLLASGTESLTVRENRVLYGSERSLLFDQSIRGRPVLHGVVSLGYNALTKRVTTIAAHFVPDRELPGEPRLSAHEAELALRNALNLAERVDPTGVAFADGTHLGYFAGYDGAKPPQLVWAITAAVRGEREEFLVDSLTGIVAYRRPLSSSIAGRREPPREVTGARCECAGTKSFIPTKPFRMLPNCGRLVSMSWSPMPDVDRYVAQMALPELGWVFSDLVIDNTSPQCACEVPRTAQIRMMACNSCGCGPWSKAKIIEVDVACPVLDDQPTD